MCASTLRSMLTAALLLTGGAMPASAVTLDVQIAFDRTTMQAHEEIAKRFAAANPDIRINFLTAAKNYEEASQRVLRGAVVGEIPDVSYQGLNLLRLLVDRGLAVPLDRFIAEDGGEAKLGYQAAMLGVGRQRNAIYGIPFAVSTPVLYVNADLVRKAGGDMNAFPKTWEEIVALGKRIDNPAAKRMGFYYQWDITGNWMFQALLFSMGGRMLSEDERKVAFDSPEGLWALKALEMFARSGMPNLTSAQSRPAFIAGTIGILADFDLQRRQGDARDRQVLRLPHPGLPAPGTERPRSRGRQSRRDADEGSCKAGGGVEIHQVRDRPDRPDDHGEQYRLHAEQRHRDQGSGHARQIL